MSERYVRAVGYLGALANWGIPVAALASMQDDPSKINPAMTATLAGYSMLFVRWSLAIFPPNYPLFACHVTNTTAQLGQLGRWFFLGRSIEEQKK
eukprot:Clim_evm3s65 gene=Clim_evmTU3s65